MKTITTKTGAKQIWYNSNEKIAYCVKCDTENQEIFYEFRFSSGQEFCYCAVCADSLGIFSKELLNV